MRAGDGPVRASPWQHAARRTLAVAYRPPIAENAVQQKKEQRREPRAGSSSAPRRNGKGASSRPQAPRQASAPARIAAWFSALFSRQVRIERRGFNIHVLLEAPAEPAGSPRQRESGRGGVQLGAAQVEAMRSDLAAVLDRHPTARQVLRHLGVLEQALKRDAARALDKLPLDVLRKATQQLDTLTGDQAPKGLAALRSALGVALVRREPVSQRRARAEVLSDFDVANKLQVDEVGVSVFQAAERQWGKAGDGSR